MEDYLNNDNVVCIYRFGSYVYGTNNEFSDEDFVVILKEYQESKDDNIHHFSEVQFQDLINRHDVQALECIFLPADLILKLERKFRFFLDKYKLRTSISTITSNSWVKGKKKLIIIDDYDLNLGLKSIFHALRILDYGIQIAEHNKIINYSSMNYVLDDLIKLSKAFQRSELWEMIDAKYRKLFNLKSSLFKDLCPKDLNEANKRKAIEALFSKYGVSNPDLIGEIMQIL
jgi:hypothetical protein